MPGGDNAYYNLAPEGKGIFFFLGALFWGKRIKLMEKEHYNGQEWSPTVLLPRTFP